MGKKKCREAKEEEKGAFWLGKMSLQVMHIEFLPDAQYKGGDYYAWLKSLQVWIIFFFFFATVRSELSQV